MNHRDEDRAAEVRGALVKALAVVVVIGVVIAIGTTLVVRTLGLDEGGESAPAGAPSGPSEPLPTTALPVPGDDEEAEEEPEDLVTPKEKKKGRLQLEVSPARAKAMERVNLTGAYRQADNVELQVQRFENGAWADFGVSATVRLGTYATYVMTGRTGPNRFRMYDPSAELASNEVRVTIG